VGDEESAQAVAAPLRTAGGDDTRGSCVSWAAPGLHRERV